MTKKLIERIEESWNELFYGVMMRGGQHYFRDSHGALMAGLGKLSDADLKQPYSHFQPGDPDEERPVIGWVAGNTYEHYAEHIGWINQLVKESSAAR